MAQRKAGHILFDPAQVIAALRLAQSQSSGSDAEQRLLENCRQHGLTFHGNTPADGNCFFHAVSDQLSLLGLPHQSAAQLRRSAVLYLRDHPSVEGPSGIIELSTTQPDWDAYLESMSRDGEWADAIILVAMANMLKHDILVVTSSPQGTGNQAYQWVVGDIDFKGTPIMLGHVWEWHYRSLVSYSGSNDLPVQDKRDRSHKRVFESVDQRHSLDATGFIHPKLQSTQGRPKDLDSNRTNPISVFNNPTFVTGNQYIVSGDQNVYSSRISEEKSHYNDRDSNCQDVHHYAEPQHLHKCREKLKQIYSKKRGEIRFGSSWKSVADTDNLFVNLKLLPIGRRKIQSTGESLESYMDILQIKDDKGKPCSHILLRGCAGTGKSTMISRIAYQWATLGSDTQSEYLSKYRLVIALDVRKFEEGGTLEQAIQKQLLPEVPEYEIRSVICFLGNRCLFLVDGLDEISQKTWTDENQVLDSPLLACCYIIVTTRPHMVDKFCQKEVFDCVHMELLGFSEESVDVYIEKFFAIQEKSDLASSLSQQIKNVSILKSLSTFPLLLLMLCHIWLDPDRDHNLPESLTELYTEAILYLNKHWEENYKEDKDKVQKELGRIAIDNLFANKLTFETKGVSVDYITAACTIGLVFEEEMERNRKFITFIHKTFHEFCAAYYWASLAESNEKKFMSYLQMIDDGNVNNMEYLLRFCCGLGCNAASFILPHVHNLTRQEGKCEKELTFVLFNEAQSHEKLQSNHWVTCKMPKKMSKVCKSVTDLRIVLTTKMQYKVCTLQKFLGCMPALKKLTLSNISITGKLDMGILTVCKKIKNFKIGDSVEITINSLIGLLSCMPSLKAIDIGCHVEILEQFDEGITVVCKKVEHLRRNGRTVSRHSVNTLGRLLSGMPSRKIIEIHDINISRDLDYSVHKVCEKLKQCQIKDVKISGNSLIGLLGCMPSLKETTLKNVTISGDFISTNMSQLYLSLTQFRISNMDTRSDIFISMLIGLMSCMPLLESIDIHGTKIIGELVESVSVACKNVKHCKIEWVTISVNSLIGLLGCMPSLKQTTLENVTISGEFRSTNMSQLGLSLTQFRISNTDTRSGISISVLIGLLSCMPLLESIDIHGTKIIGEFDESVSVACKNLKQCIIEHVNIWKSLKLFNLTFITINASSLVTLINYVPSLEHLKLYGSIIQWESLDVKLLVMWESLKVFNLNYITINASSLVVLINHMPSLEHLTLCGSTIQRESLNVKLLVVWKSLKVLNLTRVNINALSTSMTLLTLLNHMPSLESLTLDGGSIQFEIQDVNLILEFIFANGCHLSADTLSNLKNNLPAIDRVLPIVNVSQVLVKPFTGKHIKRDSDSEFNSHSNVGREADCMVLRAKQVQTILRYTCISVIEKLTFQYFRLDANQLIRYNCKQLILGACVLCVESISHFLDSMPRLEILDIEAGCIVSEWGIPIAAAVDKHSKSYEWTWITLKYDILLKYLEDMLSYEKEILDDDMIAGRVSTWSSTSCKPFIPRKSVYEIAECKLSIEVLSHQNLMTVVKLAYDRCKLKKAELIQILTVLTSGDSCCHRILALNNLKISVKFN